MTSNGKPKILIICGPTASGKSNLSIKIAQENDGEIICGDATQIYKDISILSSSPSEEDKNQIPHHLYNFKNLDEVYSAGKFLEDALPVIKDISERKKLPIIVGGTGLYILALLEGISQIPDIPDNLRKQTRELFDELGNENFHKKLAKIDPKASTKLDPGNSQRLIRAYEVYQHTGKSIYDFHNEKISSPLDEYDVKVIIIEGNREKLYKKCNDRFSQMLDSGAIDEVKKIAEKYDPEKIKAIGYKEIYQYIKEEIDFETLIKIATQKTRNYAKRQVTFFKSKIEGERIDMDDLNERDFKLHISG